MSATATGLVRWDRRPCSELSFRATVSTVGGTTNSDRPKLADPSYAEYVRQAVLRSLEADGVKIRRGAVEIAA